MDAFTAELERQINALATADGAAVSGSPLIMTPQLMAWSLPAALPKELFVKVSGDAIWGLANTESAHGETSS